MNKLNMELPIKVGIVVFSIVTPLAIGVYYFGPQINEGLKSPIAANLLLIILIIVDGSGGVLGPFLSGISKREIKNLKIE
jgi:hypothetical protein